MSFYVNQLLIILILFWISNPGLSQHVIDYLPGFEGKLPFKLVTGYIGVGENKEVQLFYYFFESESNPNTDPLMLWLTGGPGCSAISALMFEVGPFTVDRENSKGSIPTLMLNKYSWTKVANIIFIDQPVGTGFSYATTKEAYYTNDTLSALLTYEFLQKWLIGHPKFQKNPLYISGCSYAGIMVPLVVNQVFNGIEAGTEPHMNLKGYTLGNPYTDSFLDRNAKIEYAHRMALLSDKLYESAKESCHGNFIHVDPHNELCLNDLDKVKHCLDRICSFYILGPFCSEAPRDKQGVLSSVTPSNGEISTNFIKLVAPTTKLRREEITYFLQYKWVNDKFVQKALHTREGTIKEWLRCNNSIQNEKLVDGNIIYTKNVASTLSFHKYFSHQNCRALIYSGDHDIEIPHISTERWIESIVSLQSDWRPWFVEDQVAGYTMTYGSGDYQLTYATVKGSGHTATEYKPQECFAMINRWFAQSSL